MKDMLKDMFSKQLSFQKRFKKDMVFTDHVDMQRYISMNLLACYAELAEIQQETMWKNPLVSYGWKNSQKFNMKAYKEEIIDLWHFVMNLWLASGCTAEMFYKSYLKKVEENERRQDTDY